MKHEFWRKMAARRLTAPAVYEAHRAFMGHRRTWAQLSPESRASWARFAKSLRALVSA